MIESVIYVGRGNAIDVHNSIIVTLFRQSELLGKSDDAIDPPSPLPNQPPIFQGVLQ